MPKSGIVEAYGDSIFSLKKKNKPFSYKSIAWIILDWLPIYTSWQFKFC